MNSNFSPLALSLAILSRPGVGLAVELAAKAEPEVAAGIGEVAEAADTATM
jgi:hypothetical protein